MTGDRPDSPSRRKRIAGLQLWIAPVVLTLCMTLPHLADGDWMRGDSGWYAAIGLQAWRTGELWTLYADPGQPYFNKPPLVFWIVGLLMHAFGASAWTARLPSVAAAVASVVLSVAIAKRLAGRRVACAVGLVLPFTYEFFRRTREISLDMWQLGFLLGTVLLVVRGVQSRRAGPWMLAAGVPLGLALMTKPLMGLVALPLLGVWLTWIRRWRQSAWLAGTLAVSIAIAAPWHVSMMIQHDGAFSHQYFGSEIADRAIDGAAFDGGSPDPLFYFRQLLHGYWPWLVCVVLSLVLWARHGMITRDGALERFALTWGIGWLILLTAFPDRRDRYSLVLFPALAMLSAIWLVRLAPPSWRRVVRRACFVAAPACVVLAGVVSALPVRLQSRPNPQWPALEAWIDANGVTELWAGAFDGVRGSRVYLTQGWWPRPTYDQRGNWLANPPRGALIVYHDEIEPRPGDNEHEVLRLGDLSVTRLEGDQWRPHWPAD